MQGKCHLRFTIYDLRFGKSVNQSIFFCRLTFLKCFCRELYAGCLDH